MTWNISPEELAEWCRDVIAKYPPGDVDLFLIRLGAKPTPPKAIRSMDNAARSVWTHEALERAGLR